MKTYKSDNLMNEIRIVLDHLKHKTGWSFEQVDEYIIKRFEGAEVTEFCDRCLKELGEKRK